LKLTEIYAGRIGLNFGEGTGIRMLNKQEWTTLSALCESAISLIESTTPDEEAPE